jgi:hypothetical protein
MLGGAKTAKNQKQIETNTLRFALRFARVQALGHRYFDLKIAVFDG